MSDEVVPVLDGDLAGLPWNWWAVYCGPQSCRSPSPSATLGV